MQEQTTARDRSASRIPPSAWAGDEPPARALLVRCGECGDAAGVEAYLESSGLVVLHNPGNLVPPYGAGQVEMEQAIEAALHRGARDVIVCGHVGCQPIARLLAPDLAGWNLELAAWLEHAEAVQRSVPDLPGDDRLQWAVERNVLQQLTQLRSHPAVAAGVFRSQVRLWAWLYDPLTEELLAHDDRSGCYVCRPALDPRQNHLYRPEQRPRRPRRLAALADAGPLYLA
jgi:carbonic anhydrase